MTRNFVPQEAIPGAVELQFCTISQEAHAKCAVWGLVGTDAFMPALSPETRRTASQPHLLAPPVPSRAPSWNGTSSAEYGVASMNMLTVKGKKYRGWFVRWCCRDVGAGSLQVFGARCGGLILIEAVHEGAGSKAILDEKHVPTLEAADLADADLAPPTSAMTFAQTSVRRSGVALKL